MRRGELDGGVPGGGLSGVPGVGEGSEVLGAVVGGQEPVAVGRTPEEHAGMRRGDGPHPVGLGIVFAAGEGSEVGGPVWPGVPSHRYGFVWSRSMPGLVAPE